MSSHRRAWLLLLCQSCYISAGQAPVCSETKTPKIVVAGSLNVDITMEVPRLPRQDETIMASSPVMRTALGGKGANQAVAAARLGVSFVGRFGSDAHASWLAQVLRSNGVDISGSSHSQLGSGQGIVMLDSSGSASSVVVGGSNTDWPALSQSERSRLLQGAAAVLLQREIPEEVNIAFAQAAKAAGARVFLDAGGQDAPISDSLLRLVDVFCPNESELQRLTGLSTSTRAEVVTAAKALRARGAAAVLVTLGARGALLVAEGQELDTPALAVPGGRVVDATAAGDAFRAAMAGWSDALRLAAAAGAIAVATAGAEPSLPNRSACDALAFGTTPRTPLSVAEGQCNVAAEVPDQLRFASRLNSMKARGLAASLAGSILIGCAAGSGRSPHKKDAVMGAELLKKAEEGLAEGKEVNDLKKAKEVTWWMRLVQHHGSKTGTPPFLFDGEFPSFLARLGAILGAAGAKQAAAEELADVRLVLLRLRLRSCDGLAWVRSQTGTDNQDEDGTTWALAAAVGPDIRRSAWLERWQHRPWTFTGAMEGQLASAAARIAILSHCMRAQVKGGINVLDPCVGSGTLAMAAAMETEVTKVFCVDVRDFAEHLEANLQFANVPDIQKMTLLEPQDVSDPLPEAVLAATDIVLANPPWGKVCKTAEDGTAVMQSLISQVPWATFAFFVSTETLKEIEDLLDMHEQVTLGSSPELWAGSTDTLGLLQRQSRVRGLDMVYFNFPQHLEGLSPEAVRAALAAAGLSAGGVALRYPDSFRLGGFTTLSELNADEVVVWPQTDGYDYSFQVDYPLLWSRSLAAFRAVLDHPLCRPLKVSIEFKPTDEISRFAAVPSTAAALLFVAQVDRPNFGVTLESCQLLSNMS
eukprot:s1054_g4.t3